MFGFSHRLSFEALHQDLDSIKALALREGRRMLDQHGLQEWSFGIDSRPKRRQGQCCRSKCHISVSQSFLDGDNTTIDDLHNLLLHEIAHALTFKGHDLTWKRKYAELLLSHFGVGRTHFYLGDCRFCRRQIDRLVADASA
jgi:hypothetical protein